MTRILTTSELRDLLHYDPDTGIFRWRVTRRGTTRGAVAGSTEPDGYIKISIQRRKYRAHRLAWLHVHGDWPPEQIDHINCDRADNRLVNLRLATHAENCKNTRGNVNNTSGTKGVSWHKRRQKWQANISMNGRKLHLGYFNTREEAAAAYERAARQHHGEFARPAHRAGSVKPSPTLEGVGI